MRKLMYAFLFMAAFCIAIGAPIANAAEYNWKLGHEEVPGGYYDRLGIEFGKRLAEKSGGKIDLKVFPAETIGTSEDMLDLVRNDVLQFNFASTNHVGSVVPEAQVLILHYLFPRDLDVAMNVFRGGKFRELLDPCYRDKGFEPLMYATEGWQVWTLNKLVRTPEDMNGIKFRTATSRLVIDSYKAYGANPTPVPFSEVYSGLQLNMVEGQENPIFVNCDMKFYEVQKYMISAYVAPFTFAMIASTKLMASLPEDIRKIVVETANELTPYSFQLQEEYNNEMLEVIKTNKPDMEIIELTDAEIAAFAKLAPPVRDAYIEMAPEKGPAILKALQEDIKNFSN